MSKRQEYKEGWTTDFNISANHYTACGLCDDFVSINIETHKGHFSHHMNCNLDSLHTLSDQISDMQKVIDNAIAKILETRSRDDETE
jgi:hypothetical protein